MSLKSLFSTIQIYLSNHLLQSSGVVKIFDDFFRNRRSYFFKRMKIFNFRRPENSKDFQEKPKNFDFILKQGLNDLRTELTEHLDAINENTSEIQSSFGCMNELNSKVEKLAERIEGMELFLQTNGNFIVEEKGFEIKPLTKTEQHVFLIIYALEDEKGHVSYTDLIKKTGLPGYMVHEYISRLAEKGIPMIKKYINNAPYIKLNPNFKRVQAKENILMIDTAQKELVNF